MELVQNAAAQALTRNRKRDHSSLVLASLRWLPVKFGDFKILLLIYMAVHVLRELITPDHPTRAMLSQNTGLHVVPMGPKSGMGQRWTIHASWSHLHRDSGSSQRSSTRAWGEHANTVPGDSNPDPSCCEPKMLTSAPPCLPKSSYWQLHCIVTQNGSDTLLESMINNLISLKIDSPVLDIKAKHSVRVPKRLNIVCVNRLNIK